MFSILNKETHHLAVVQAEKPIDYSSETRDLDELKFLWFAKMVNVFLYSEH